MKILIVVLLIFSSFTDGRIVTLDSSAIAARRFPIDNSPETANTPTTTAASPLNAIELPSSTSDVTVNVTWTFTTGINVTHVVMVVNNLKSAQWAAIGLGQFKSMVTIEKFFHTSSAASSDLVF